LFSTPLRDLEEKLGANFGEFASWEMPMGFTGYQDEHMAVRTNAAVFDLFHMGRLRVRGKESELDYLVSKEIPEKDGEMSGPTAFLNQRGGFIDDVMLYRVEKGHYLVVTNAVNRQKVAEWIRRNSSLEVEDLTFNYAMLAVQGKRAIQIMGDLGLDHLKFKLNTKLGKSEVYLVSRSGWTGEEGYEIWATPDEARELMTSLIEKGAKPAGLVARDSLRMEMGFVLYGEDIDENVNPVEARYWVFSLNKDYVGKDSIIDALKDGVRRVRVGMRFEKGVRIVPRSGNRVVLLEKEIGRVTSGTFSPYLNRAIAMGYIYASHALMGLRAQVEVRSRLHTVKISDFPFIK
jgi:aminomethyltransferase